MSSSFSVFTLPLPTTAGRGVCAVQRIRSNGGSSTFQLSSSASIAPIRIRSLGLNLRLLGGSRPTNSNRRSLGCRSQLSELAPTASAVYGALLLGGGLFAYSRSGSKGSLAGGLTGAALMAATYYLMQSPETKASGDALGYGSAFLFSSVFGIRLAATRKLIPSGLLLGLSVAVLAVFVSAYSQDTMPPLP